MPRFSDLSFEPSDIGGVRAKLFFPNGYGASVISGPYTYGGRDGRYELAVLAGTAGDYALSYDTPVTSDVEGHLSKGRVTALLNKIAALPARKTEAA